MEEMYELVIDLKIWADQQNMVERSIQSFFEIVEHFQREDPEYITQHFPDFAKEHFTVMISEVGILMSMGDPDYSSVVAHIPIIYKGRRLGRYSTIFLLSGEWEDDVWHMDEIIYADDL